VAAFHPQRAVALLARATSTSEPTAALRALTALRVELDALERHQVARALRDGRTFTAIAQPLGISRQAAHRRYRDLSAAPSVTPEARAALLRAREEAARHGSPSIDSEHLLLALADCGVIELDIDGARRSFAPPARDAPPPKGLHPALHARLARSSGPLRLQHLLRAALADAAAQDLLERFGIDRVATRDLLTRAHASNTREPDDGRARTLVG
jgi:hypothetical protein